MHCMSVKRLFVDTLVALGIVVMAFNGYPKQLPEPRWTERDLPTPPAASDNGWHAVTSEPLDVEIPESLAALIDARGHGPGVFWWLVEFETELLHVFLASGEAREALARVDDARRQPEFVDVCTIEAPCRVLDWHRAHDVALLQALALAHDKCTTDALLRVRELIRMDASHLANARSLVSLLVALDQLGDALYAADMIAARADRDSLAWLAVEVRALDVDALDLRTLVMREYLFHVQALGNLDATAEKLGVPSRPRWLYNHALSLRHVDRMFARRYEGAVAGDVFTALGGHDPSPKQAIAWWLRNPVGKNLLAEAAFDPTKLAGSIDESLRDIQVLRAQVLARVSATGD
jgi:hypothetical protein